MSMTLYDKLMQIQAEIRAKYAKQKEAEAEAAWRDVLIGNIPQSLKRHFQIILRFVIIGERRKWFEQFGLVSTAKCRTNRLSRQIIEIARSSRADGTIKINTIADYARCFLFLIWSGDTVGTLFPDFTYIQTSLFWFKSLESALMARKTFMAIHTYKNEIAKKPPLKV